MEGRIAAWPEEQDGARADGRRAWFGMGEEWLILILDSKSESIMVPFSGGGEVGGREVWAGLSVDVKSE